MAQFNLGISYEIGEGVEQSYSKAIKWFLISAEQKFTDAQYNLGIMYARKSKFQDYIESKKWFTLAAEQEHPTAQFNLGAMNTNGQGCSVDYAEGAKWCKRAVDNGLVNAIKFFPRALQNLFLPGTRIELVNMSASILNGKCGFVNGTKEDKIDVKIDGYDINKLVFFENIIIKSK
jgi:TPR repeat protein